MMQLTFLKSMNKKIWVLILVLAILIGFAVFRDRPEEEPVINEKEPVEESYDELREIITGFIGTPYALGPMDEENVYEENVFDCTTLVLVTVANLHGERPEEKIKEVNYYPPGEVSYESRLHFSTYRNKVSDYFEDITAKVGEGHVNQKRVTLNEDRIIDIDWQEEIMIDYIRIEDALKVTDNLPEVAGVMFIRDGNADIGLDINHEGFILDGTDLVHASPDHGQVYREDFGNYLQRSNNDAVAFYKIN